MNNVPSGDETHVDPALALIEPGAPFELETIACNGVATRVFARGPRNLADIYRTASAYGGRVFCVQEGREWGYDELWRRAAALAALLAAHGCGPGRRVAIAMHNRPEWMIAFIAVTAAGGTAVLVNSRGTPAEITAALEVTDAQMAIADGARAQALTGRSRLRLLVVTDDAADAGPLPPHITFANACANWRQAELKPLKMAPKDEALVMFTSGTTGGSKGVLLDQRGVATGLMNIQYSMAVVGARIAARVPAPPSDAAARQPCALLAVPLFHSSGCYSIFLSNLMRGGKIVILPKWNAARALDLIERERISAFSGSPTMLWDLLRLDHGGRDLRCLVSVGVGGQALQPALLREIAAAFPGAIIGGGYGMTEANGSVCLIAGEDLLRRPTSSGRPIASADLIVADDHGSEMPTGELGEICVRGAMVMRGYCKRPDDTAAVLRDHWLRTGDLGRFDAQGYLHVVDRKKDIVISGGENISCTEVEGVAMEYPGVAEAAAFGVADERLGEILVLALVQREPLDGTALQNHIAGRLAIYKVPRALMHCAELPRNALGKVDRNALRRRYLQQG